MDKVQNLPTPPALDAHDLRHSISSKVQRYRECSASLGNVQGKDTNGEEGMLLPSLQITLPH